MSLNMVVNEIPVNCEILSANEYEGHYLYDLYHSNTSGIDPSIISTDTAGSNLVNFSILDNIDVSYAPAYKSVFNRAGGLCGFKPIESYEVLSNATKVHDTRESIERVAASTLLLAAEHDNLARVEDMKRIQRKIRNSYFRTITEAGHGLMLENPEGVIDAVIEFCGK